MGLILLQNAHYKREIPFSKREMPFSGKRHLPLKTFDLLHPRQCIVYCFESRVSQAFLTGNSFFFAKSQVAISFSLNFAIPGFLNGEPLRKLIARGVRGPGSGSNSNSNSN